MELQEVMEYLLTEGFVTVHKGKPKFTAIFHSAYSGVEKGLTQAGTVLEPNLGIAPPALLQPSPQTIAAYRAQDWVTVYMQFISECQVPRRCINRQGDPYDTNKYSEDGMKAFKQAIQSGTDYKMLVRSTVLYYKSATRLKKAIGNYMSHGDWRTDYQDLVTSAELGTEAVSKHIKETTNDGKSDHYGGWG